MTNVIAANVEDEIRDGSGGGSCTCPQPICHALMSIHLSWQQTPLRGGKSCICPRMPKPVRKLNLGKIQINLMHSYSTDSTSFGASRLQQDSPKTHCTEEQSNCQAKHRVFFFTFRSSTGGCSQVNSTSTTLLQQRDSADHRLTSITQVAMKGRREGSVCSPACVSC